MRSERNGKLWKRGICFGPRNNHNDPNSTIIQKYQWAVQQGKY